MGTFFLNFQKNITKPDATIVLNKHVLHVHKDVLTTSSLYFAKAFSSNMQESNNNEIKMNNMLFGFHTVTSFIHVIDAIYDKIIKIKPDNTSLEMAECIVKWADYLMLDKILFTKCAEFFLATLSIHHKNSIKHEGLIELACKCKQKDVALLIIKNAHVKLLNKKYGKLEWTELQRASRNGETDVVEELIKRIGLDVNTRNLKKKNALYLACIYDNLEIVKLLLNYENIDLNICPVLHGSCNLNRIEIVKLLLKNEDIDVNVKRGDETALQGACREGHLEIVKLLLEKEDIDVNVRDYTDNTALHEACYGGYVEIAKLLINHKNIGMNTIDKELDTCSRYNKVAILQFLLEKEGINVNVRAGYFEETALMNACEKGYIEIAKLLINHKNIDVNLKNNKFETALELALKKGHTEIVNLLINHKTILE
jgi:ankyrin repeat protein